ncbi:MAG: hypothetical protein ACR2PQ_05755 [Myxococcota bacterium]
MNFYAHAVVAEARRTDAEFVLGSMLPDLAAMAGLRVAGADSNELRQGIRLHHESDERFHTCALFGALTRDGARDLQTLGLRRGPARGAAHVGIELLLDGWLVDARPPTDAYRSAIDHAAACSDTVQWRTPPTEAWHRLCARIATADATDGYKDPAEVARRTARTLARRPRLALAEREFGPLETWLRTVRARVAHHGPALLEAAGRDAAKRSGATG